MTDHPAFDEVHVVSDLHMGGRAGFQILRETRRLAGFIGRLAGQPAQRRVALVLNGDVFDTLAEDIAGYVALEDACRVVARIMDDASFAPVWDALAGFVRQPGRTLAIVIGNHDVEIAFPTVQRLVQSRLAGDDLEARARIEFSTTGAGYACRVGGARVYCIHGNEVDAWNYNRYEDLARAGRRLNAGMPPGADEWRPNAGTRMVKEVMNEVKRRYAWIDLLKPETAAAVGTLLVLDPSQARKIGRLAGIVGEYRRGGAQVEARLSASDHAVPAAAPAPGPTLEQLLGPHLRRGLGVAGAAAGGGVRDMLLAAERNRRAGAVPPAARVEGTLGAGQLVVDRLTGWLTGVSRTEALRRALLDWLEDDRSFDTDHRDDTFREVSAAVGPDVDIVVTGHTHLERAIDAGGGRWYFNSGTWIRLLRFTRAMLASEQAFEAVNRVLVDGRMQAIDEARFEDHRPFVLDQTGVVSIRDDGDGRVTGTLAHVEGDGSGEPRPVQTFTRS